MLAQKQRSRSADTKAHSALSDGRQGHVGRRQRLRFQPAHGEVKASANRSKRVLLVFCSSSSDDEAAGPQCKAGEVLRLNLTPHQACGVTSVSPAVLIPFATPCLSGARGATSTCQPGGRRTGINSRGARGHGPAALPVSTRPAPEAEELEQRWEENERSGPGRRTTLDGQPSATMKIAILDLVHGTFFPMNSILGKFLIAVVVHLHWY